MKGSGLIFHNMKAQRTSEKTTIGRLTMNTKIVRLPANDIITICTMCTSSSNTCLYKCNLSTGAEGDDLSILKI